MKYLYIIIFLLSLSTAIFSQSFNDGKILRPGHYSVGINPVLEGKSPGGYVRGGYGISKRMDVNIKYGVFEGDDYLGADVEWFLKSNRKMDLSLVTGAHTLRNFGLDAGLAAGFPINTHATFFSGIDADLNFNINHDRFFWIPIGVKLFLSSRVRIIIEADIPVVDFAPGIFGGGLSFNLN